MALEVRTSATRPPRATCRHRSSCPSTSSSTAVALSRWVAQWFQTNCIASASTWSGSAPRCHPRQQRLEWRRRQSRPGSSRCCRRGQQDQRAFSRHLNYCPSVSSGCSERHRRSIASYRRSPRPLPPWVPLRAQALSSVRAALWRLCQFRRRHPPPLRGSSRCPGRLPWRHAYEGEGPPAAPFPKGRLPTSARPRALVAPALLEAPATSVRRLQLPKGNRRRLPGAGPHSERLASGKYDHSPARQEITPWAATNRQGYCPATY
mmetsp:Transcript_80597/g.224257  ORF Transcript_80597/g.224257 Transcript_80597/m.224257 type:complete len:263 (+) Transcript_80597:1876-2664(+)